MTHVGTLARENGALRFIWETEPEARNKLWKARHELGYAVMATCIGKLVGNWKYAVSLLTVYIQGITTDVCVPISKLPDVLIETKEDLDRSGLRGGASRVFFVPVY